MFKLNLIWKKQKRRVSVVEELDFEKVQYHIRGAIYIFECQGYAYFTRSMILDFLNKQIGWPRLQDTQSLDTFDLLLRRVLKDYQPHPTTRGGYSFKLKGEGANLFKTKVLKGN